VHFILAAFGLNFYDVLQSTFNETKNMTTPILDFDALIAPIPGEDPAGKRLAPDVRKKIEDGRKDFEPDPDDPSKPPVPKKPDWAGIIKLATTALTSSSKDLLASVRMVEALTKRNHFAGLRDGLKLLRLLVTDCWDRMHPIIEEPDDIESRAGSFEWLCESNSGAWFPTTISQVPLLKVGSQTVSLSDCQKGMIEDKPLDQDMLKSAVPADPTTPADVAQCLEELEALDQAMVDKMAQQAPSVTNLREVLTACQRYLARTQAPAESESSEEISQTPEAETGEVMTSSIQKVSTGAMNRAEAYRQLARLADQLAQLEPHSPIPDLLRWAVKLGALPFRELIHEFVRDSGVLDDIRRQFGIKENEGG
jgi:type VI secretion system protein ImpA